jgi:hypothetical protein
MASPRAIALDKPALLDRLVEPGDKQADVDDLGISSSLELGIFGVLFTVSAGFGDVFVRATVAGGLFRLLSVAQEV